MSEQSEYIWYNSEIIPWNQANIHVMSHVIHYGSGVFEGIKCYDTPSGPAIFRLEDHIVRLYKSAEFYSMDVKINKSKIIDGCKNIVIKNSLKTCYIRPIIFYGYDTMGVHPKDCPINIAIAAFKWGAYLGEKSLNKGADVTISPYSKFSYKSMPTIAKASGHYTNSLLAVLDAKKRGFAEAILLNEDGNISEGSGQNIFFIKDDVLYTNNQFSSILLGITRDTIIKIAKNNGINVIIKSFTPKDLLNSDEAFFSGTATEVTPIRSIDHKLISDGNVGPLTQLFKNEYQDIVTGQKDNDYSWLTLLQ